jgi:predicted  nucleic acid-binding Zn-ribbon protein
MQADNTHHLLAAARERSQKARARATEAMTRIRETGRTTTVSELARTAGVSCSWLYTQPDLLDLLHQRKTPTRTATPGSSTQASGASLHRRLQIAHQRIRQLTDENTRLRERLARTHGALRTANQTNVSGHS